MFDKQYDVIVSGVGSMGAAACYYLARQGLKVLGLEQFKIPNELASHTGQSRIIRKAYFEHPDYVPLLEQAYSGWNELEKKTGQQVFYKTGLLYMGPVTHPVMKGVKNSGRLYNIPLHNDHQAGNLFHFSSETSSIFETDAGFLIPHTAIELFSKLAVEAGAEIRSNERVKTWEKRREGLLVRTEKQEYRAEKLLITSGAWTGKIAQELASFLKITRQLLIWMQPEDPELYRPGNFPCWLIAGNDINGAVYGFPYLDGDEFGKPSGLKAAVHFPAETWDPDDLHREPRADEVRQLFELVKKYLPGMKEVNAAKTCLYSNSPDENFIIDFLPRYDNRIIVACGFSGHGFKFVPVIGEALADLVVKGGTGLPIGFLSLNRFK